MTMGDPPVAHGGVESNIEAFVLRPTVTDIDAPDATHLTMTFHPEVGRTQRVVLLLNEVHPPTARAPRACSFKAPPDNGITDESTETATITFPLQDVAPGVYLVRVQVDRAESPLTIDTDQNSPTFNEFIGPTVTIS